MDLGLRIHCAQEFDEGTRGHDKLLDALVPKWKLSLGTEQVERGKEIAPNIEIAIEEAIFQSRTEIPRRQDRDKLSQ